jgi:DNA-binding NarL/FixJ family response regulator
MNGQQPIRILLAEGKSLVREALRVALQRNAGLFLVAEAGDGRTAVAEAERKRPDLALLDIDLPDFSGVRATEMIRSRVPTRVLLLGDGEDLHMLIKAVNAGASGYMSRSRPLGELIEATTAIHRGEMVVPPALLEPLVRNLLSRAREQDEVTRLRSRLSRRESEVLALVARSADNQEIARTLAISPQTARTHVQNILTKLGVHSRLQAAAFAIRAGLMDESAGVER